MVHFSTLEAIYIALDCEPSDILEYIKDALFLTDLFDYHYYKLNNNLNCKSRPHLVYLGNKKKKNCTLEYTA